MDEWKKTWFEIDGRLEDIKFNYESHFRFPEELAEIIISKYSKKGDRVLDPFCGLGTTLMVAEKLGRQGVGFEVDAGRADFASKRGGRVISDSAKNVLEYALEPFDLLFTSPPYLSFNDRSDPDGKSYVAEITEIFGRLKHVMKDGSHIIVEMANLRREDGFRPQAWEVGIALSKQFTLLGEIIRCNTSDFDAGGNNNHSYVLVFKK